MKNPHTYFILSLLLGVLLLVAHPLQADQEDVFGRIIELPGTKASIYKLLGLVTDRTGYLFIYDSNNINNEQMVKLKAGRYSVRQAIIRITGNNRLEMRLVGSHILLSLPADTIKTTPSTPHPQQESHFTLAGTLCDQLTGEPIPYGSIYSSVASVGTISNLNGGFRLHLPDSLRGTKITFSHVGYEPQEVESNLLAACETVITLNPKVISIQEVVVRLVNPQRLLREMLQQRENNYSHIPVYLTTFYREGIERKKSLVNLTEAVFKVYKSAYNTHATADQIKLLKMRKIKNTQETDTLITRMKSGIHACLLLDLMKHLPEFLILNEENPYTYAHTDLTVIDNRLVNVISFEQRPGIQIPLYRGEIYIDSENSALLRVDFEVHPDHIHQAADMVVEKKSRNLRIVPQQIAYSVSYKNWNGTYYINHIRGDLHFKIKKRNQFFNSDHLHTWFEMVTCKTDTSEVSRFARNETIPTRTIFAETDFTYDEGFWEHFNVIRPEDRLNDAISKISLMIEETGGQQ